MMGMYQYNVCGAIVTFFAEDSLVSASDRLMTTSTRTNWAPIWARVWVDVA